MFMLYTEGASSVYIWVGGECECDGDDMNAEAVSKAKLHESMNDDTKVILEREGEESDEFWAEFERGY